MGNILYIQGKCLVVSNNFDTELEIDGIFKHLEADGENWTGENLKSCNRSQIVMKYSGMLWICTQNIGKLQ